MSDLRAERVAAADDPAKFKHLSDEELAGENNSEASDAADLIVRTRFVRLQK